MDKLDIILWVISGGFGLMLIMWHFLNSKLDKIENKMENLSHDVIDIKMRMYGIETVLHMKDCCVLKNDQVLKKAE